MFADIVSDDQERRLVALRDRQQVFRQVIEPALSGVEFDATQAVRWWPLGERRQVVIDPRVCFGKPVGARSGVPAVVLSQYARAHGDQAAARWYDVSVSEVRDAVEFARRHAA